MNPPYLRNIILLTCGFVLSALLTVLVAGWTGFGGPGAYVVHYLFPPWHVGQDIMGKVLLVYFSTTFILVFVVLGFLYLAVAGICRRKS